MQSVHRLVTAIYFTILVLVTSSSCTNDVHLNTRIIPRKTWWAKQITPQLYTAGRLTENEYKYGGEVGFKSIVSNLYYEEGDWIGQQEYVPSTDEAELLVSELVQVPFGLVNGPGASWKSLDASVKFTEIYFQFPKPVLLHCTTGRTATFTALMFLTNRTAEDPNWEPEVDAEEFYRIGASLGYDFASDPQIVAMVEELTGETVKEPATPDAAVVDWNSRYWRTKPLYKNWFINGQIQTNHLDLVVHLGVKAMINTRRGMASPPENIPSQEGVILLNVKDGTGTYVGNGRQSEEQILQNILSPEKTSEYISVNSSVNYAVSNSLQFGDDVGYNEDRQKAAIDAIDALQYVLTPIGGQYNFTVEMFDAYVQQWLDAAKSDQVVMVHSDSGYRAVVAGLLGAGIQHGLDSDWAIRRAAELGYHLNDNNDAEVVQLLKDVLHIVTSDNNEDFISSGADVMRIKWRITLVIVYTSLRYGLCL